MKILITYRDSFLGTFIKEKLKSSLEIVDREADYEDPFETDAFLRQIKPDIIILNIPFSGGIKLNTNAPADLFIKNILIQTNVIRHAFGHGVKRLVFVGSSCMYPKIYDRSLTPEDLFSGPLEETNLAYATAKIAGWQMCKACNRQYGVKYATLIPANLYGEFDDFDEENAHVVGALMARFHKATILEEKEVVIWGTGTPIRDFLYAADFADALSFLIKKDIFPEEINIGSGKGHSIKEIAEEIAKTVGYNGSIVFDTKKPDGMKKKVLDVEKINQLGWFSKTSLQEGLVKTYGWYQESVLRQKGDRS